MTRSPPRSPRSSNGWFAYLILFYAAAIVAGGITVQSIRMSVDVPLEWRLIAVISLTDAVVVATAVLGIGIIVVHAVLVYVAAAKCRSRTSRLALAIVNLILGIGAGILIGVVLRFFLDLPRAGG